MHPHRSSALGYASAASAEHSRVYAVCSAEAAASESSGLSVGGCPEHRRYFGPYPVRTRAGGMRDEPGPWMLEANDWKISGLLLTVVRMLCVGGTHNGHGPMHGVGPAKNDK